jgi:hypothetical protein
MKPLVCVDCKWSIPTPASELFGVYFCKASEKTNLVTGKPEYQFCSVMRLEHEPCGIDGKLFDLNVGEQPQGGEDFGPYHTH